MIPNIVIIIFLLDLIAAYTIPKYTIIGPKNHNFNGSIIKIGSAMSYYEADEYFLVKT